jgi:hypothetical protein
VDTGMHMLIMRPILTNHTRDKKGIILFEIARTVVWDLNVMQMKLMIKGRPVTIFCNLHIVMLRYIV